MYKGMACNAACRLAQPHASQLLPASMIAFLCMQAAARVCVRVRGGAPHRGGDPGVRERHLLLRTRVPHACGRSGAWHCHLLPGAGVPLAPWLRRCGVPQPAAGPHRLWPSKSSPGSVPHMPVQLRLTSCTAPLRARLRRHISQFRNISMRMFDGSKKCIAARKRLAILL
jgi:hypothetical protein